MESTRADAAAEGEPEQQLRLDAADVFRIGDQRPDRPWLEAVPPESVSHRVGDQVLVWATREESGGGCDLQPGTVLEFDDSPEGAGRFAVRLDGPAARKKRVVTYASGPPRRSLLVDTFSHAFRAGHCGALERRRIFVRLYAVAPPAAPALQGERRGWRGLLVGPGARPLGRFCAEKLGLQPDADASSTAIGDGEHCWLNLRGDSAGDVRARVIDVARSAWTAYTPLLRLLEEGQAMALRSVSDTEVCLAGCNAHALLEPLRRAVPGATARTAPTSCARVARETLWLRVPRAAALTQQPLEQRVRSAVEAALPHMDLPETALLAAGHDPPALPRRSGCWRLSEEGPDARHPGLPDAAWPGAYVCPANVLAVAGPRAEVCCLLNYAIQQGAAPVAVQAEEVPPEIHRVSRSTPARAAAFAAGGAGGLGAEEDWQHRKRQGARGRYYGYWPLCDFTDEEMCGEEAAQRMEERLLMEDVMGAWNQRNIRNQLEGQLCMRPPSALELRLRLRPHCAAIVEYEDFRDLQGSEVFCVQGAVGTGNERLWNPAFPSPTRPQGWVCCEAPEYWVRLLVLSLPGAAFPLAKARESVEVRLQQTQLSLLEASAPLRRHLHSAFRAQRRHVRPVPLPDWRGEEAVEGVTPLPLCPSLHPPLLRIAAASALAVPDLEDWAQKVTEGALPCSLCGGDAPECQRLLNDKIQGLVSVRARSEHLVATLPTVWRPRPARLHPTAARAPQSAAALADDAAPQRAMLPAAPAADEALREICCGAPGLREHWGALEPTMARLRVAAPRTAQASVLCLARYLAEQAQCHPAEELLQALPLATSGQALTSLVAAARLLLPGAARSSGGREEARLQPLLQELHALRQCAPAWDSRVLLRLAALPDTQADAAGLASLLRCVRAGVDEEQSAAVAVWTGEALDSTQTGLRRLFVVLGERTQRKQRTRATAQERRASFAQALLAARGQQDALRLSVRLLLVARGPHLTLSTEPASWGPVSLRLWAERTAAWGDEASAAQLLHAAAHAGLAADKVLALFARAADAQGFRQALETLRQGGEQGPQEPPPPQAARSALQRTREQLTAPEAGCPRWRDAHQQPEHQALLLAHVLRELLTLLAALACDAPRDLDFCETTALLRGDPEYLAAEAQHQAPLPPRSTGGFWADERTRDILTRGSSSRSPLTGGCVPRRAAWLAGRQEEADQ